MFIVEKNNEIILADENREQLETTLKFMPDCVDCEIVETPRPIAEIDGKFVYADTAEYKEAKNAEIAKVRGNLYTELVDPLHAQKNKDTIMGEWSEEKEQEYIAEVKRLTIKIREENPYLE